MTIAPTVTTRACPYCGAPILTPVVASTVCGLLVSKGAWTRHVRACVRRRPAERAYFRERGVWPDRRRQWARDLRAVLVLALMAVLPSVANGATADVLRGCYAGSEVACAIFIADDATVTGPSTSSLLWADNSAIALLWTGETLCAIKNGTEVAERNARHQGLTCGQWAAYLRDYIRRGGGLGSAGSAAGLCLLYDPVCGVDR